MPISAHQPRGRCWRYERCDPAAHGRPWCLGVRWNRHDESPHVSGHSAGSGAMLRTLVMLAKSASATSTRRTAVCQRAFVGVGVERAVAPLLAVSVRARVEPAARRTVSDGGRTAAADPRPARRQRPRELETKRLCEVCAEVTGMSGAGIMLMSGDVPRGSVCTTDEVSALIEQLQYDLGRRALRRRLPPGPARARARPGRPRDAAVARLHRAGPRRGRAGRLRLPAPGRRRPPRRAQPVPRPAGAAHRRPARRRAGHGRRRRPGRPGAAGRRAAREAGRRAGGGRRLPVRRAPGVGHGRRPARRQRRPGAHPAAGATPSATTVRSPRWPTTWWPGRCASTPERRAGLVAVSDRRDRRGQRVVRWRRVTPTRSADGRGRRDWRSDAQRSDARQDPRGAGRHARRRLRRRRAADPAHRPLRRRARRRRRRAHAGRTRRRPAGDGLLERGDARARAVRAPGPGRARASTATAPASRS